MSCMCGATHRREDHYFDGKCGIGCCSCRQFESADMAPEDMGRVPVVERRAVEIVRHTERAVIGSMPRGDE